MSSTRDRRRPARRRHLRPVADTGAPVLARRLVGDLRRLAPVVALVRDEVLEDDLLDVAVARMRGGERLQRRDPLLLRLPDPDEDPAGERDAQLAGCVDGGEPELRVLRRRARVDGLHQPLGDRLEHQPLRRGDLTQPGEVVTLEHAEVRVRQQPALERALARPRHIGREVGVAVLGEELSDARVHLGPLARQDEQLLDVALRGAVQQLLDLVGRPQVRLVRGERAVLAVAPAGPRERQRQVAREGDPAAHPGRSLRGGGGGRTASTRRWRPHPERHRAGGSLSPACRSASCQDRAPAAPARSPCT